MTKMFLFLLGLFGCLMVALAGCGDKVSDPEALYQKYLKDDAAREAKMKECNLLSTDEQLKKQTCEIARKASAQHAVEHAGDYWKQKRGKKE